MSDIIFKRLFEVRILHGYYLDHWYPDGAGKSDWFHGYSTDRQAFVLENKYNVLRYLDIAPTSETSRLLKDLKMRWRTIPAGFLVGIEVNKTGDGAAAKFTPKIMPLAASAWRFVLRVRDPYFYNLTNHVLRPTMPGRYYFSNIQDNEERFPSLSVALPGFSGQRTWEMGELIQEANMVKAADITTDALNNNIFTQIAEVGKDWHHYAHLGDRRALPKIFKYRFDPKFAGANAVKNTVFTLLNGANEVKTISKNFELPNPPAPLEWQLDFTYLPLPPNPTEEEKLKPKPLPDGWYTLKVDINGGLFEEKKVLLRSDLPNDISAFGLVEISMDATAPAFRLFNADDSLNLSVIPNSSPARWQPPIFEIRLMSRPTYWHYQLEKDPVPDPSNAEFQYLAASKRLVATKPRRLSAARAPTLLQDDFYLPNPDKPDLKYDQNRYYSELFLSTIKIT